MLCGCALLHTIGTSHACDGVEDHDRTVLGLPFEFGCGPVCWGVLVSSKFGIGVMGVRGAPGESCLDQEHFELIGRREQRKRVWCHVSVVPIWRLPCCIYHLPNSNSNCYQLKPLCLTMVGQRTIGSPVPCRRILISDFAVIIQTAADLKFSPRIIKVSVAGMPKFTPSLHSFMS